MSKQVSFKLPKKLREQVFGWHEIVQMFADRHFDRIPQLLRMPSGRRIKWTKQGESKSYDPPQIFVRNIERKEKQIMRDIQSHLVELKYEEAKQRFGAYLQG